MNCEAFLDHLYDNDVRAAGRGLGKLPPDMAAHMLVCDKCRAAYHAARVDDLLLTRALLDVPSPAWRAEVLRQIARVPRTSWSQRIATVNEVVIWGILAVAASQILLGQARPPRTSPPSGPAAQRLCWVRVWRSTGRRFVAHCGGCSVGFRRKLSSA